MDEEAQKTRVDAKQASCCMLYHLFVSVVAVVVVSQLI